MGKSRKVKTRQRVTNSLSKACDSEYVQYRNSGERITLEDSGTKLFIKAKCNMRYLKVDRGILQDSGYKNSKCDFLCENLDERHVHLIEMKHKDLDDAYDQLRATPEAIEKYTKYGEIFVGLECLDAYIVSPGTQKIPEVSKSKSCTQLCRMLAKHSTKRVEDIFKLLYFVKVVQKNAGESGIAGRILCSNDKPLEF